MATPKRLNFSDNETSPSPRIKALQKSKDSKKTKQKKQLWNEDTEIAILKGLVEYRVKRRHDPEFDWDGFFNFIQGSIHADVSKKQMFIKIRELRKTFIVNMDMILQGKKPLFTRWGDSKVFGCSFALWGQNEAECDNQGMEKALQNESGGVEKAAQTESGCMQNESEGMEKAGQTESVGMEKALQNESGSMEKALQTESGGIEIALHNESEGIEKALQNESGGMENALQTENGGIEKALQNESGGMEKAPQTKSAEEAFKENEQVAANAELVNQNGADKVKFDGKSHDVDKTDGKESDNDDELCIVLDAFETMISEGLSAYQKKLQLETLKNLETRKRKELSNEWKLLCADEVELNVKKFRFYAEFLAAVNEE